VERNEVPLTEAGAAVVRARYGESLARFDKSPTDFATLADIEAEKAILDVLRTARPEDALLGEESGYHGPYRADRTWLVDPLCGSLHYAARTALVAVNVALRTGKDIQVAASADPLSAELFLDRREARLCPSQRRG
jgi:myo-inositol-1(or 4)-monophosphatase